MLKQLLFVDLGGGIGNSFRYLVSLWFSDGRNLSQCNHRKRLALI